MENREKSRQAEKSSARETRIPREERSLIGSGLRVKGDIMADERLEVGGQVEGSIIARQQDVTIRESARVKGEIFAATLVIEGQTQGNLHASERITVRRSSEVQGEVYAKRISLEEGCKFKGRVDTEAEVPTLAAEALAKAKGKR